ncbi:hypothetical protein SteCoe_18518 [Stentor coeruleus]|uniref:Ion transport domain-containing protein n=1 Tax=Stentor coeruleus TaxID=5963 RepID=A0A1R2BWX5_9CILI|nr:hypothetical protein SteCoe_18518 [Stentor coeruleus]
MFSEKVAPETKFEDQKVDDSRLPESDVGSKEVKLEEINQEDYNEEPKGEEVNLLKKPSEINENMPEEKIKEKQYQEMKYNLIIAADTVKSKFEIKSNRTSDYKCLDMAISKKNSLMILLNDLGNCLYFYDLKKIDEYLKTKNKIREDEKEIKKKLSRFDQEEDSNSIEEIHIFDKVTLEIKEISSFEITFGKCTQLKISQDESKLYCACKEGYIITISLPIKWPLVIKDEDKIQVAKNEFTFDIFKNRLFFQKFNKCYLKEYNAETKTSKYICRLDKIQKLSVSQTGRYLAAIGKELIVYILNELKFPVYKKTLPKSFIESLFEKNKAYSDFQFSYNDDIFIYSCENIIKIIDAKQWVEKKTLCIPINDNICEIKLATISNRLVAISQFNSLYTWDINDNNTKPIFMNHDQGSLHCNKMKLYINEENGYAYIKEMNTDLIYYYNCNFFLCKSIAHEGIIKKIMVDNKSNKILCVKNYEPEIMIYDYNKCKFIDSIRLPKNIIDCVLVELPKIASEEVVLEDSLYILTEDYIYVCSANFVLNLEKSITLNSKNIYQYMLYGFIAQKQSIILSDSNSIAIFNLTNLEIPNEIINFSDLSEIRLLKVFRDSIIFSSQSNVLVVYDLNTKTIKSKSMKFKSELNNAYVIDKFNTIFATFNNEEIKIFESQDLAYFVVKKIQASISDGFVTNGENFFVARTIWCNIVVYSLPLFTVAFEIKGTNISMININPSSSSIIGLSNQKLLIYEDLFSHSNPIILGESIDYTVIDKFIKNSNHSSKCKEDYYFDQWILFPYMLNSLHFYSAENNKKELKHAMQQRKVTFLESYLGTPLDISLIADNNEVCNYLIKQLAENIKNDKDSVKLISKNFVEINSKSFKSLELLYDNCFVYCRDSDMPDYCDDNITLPKIFYSNSEALCAKNSPGFHKDVQDTTHKRVHFYNSVFKASLKMGSEGSIEFLKSLSESTNYNIFKTKFINCILNDKWEKVKWVHYTYSIVFIIYLLFLSMFSVNKYWPYMYVAVAANSIMNLYEVLQCVTGPLMYARDLLNFADIAKSVLLYAYLGNNSRYLLVITSCLSWIRGITIFSISRSTRPMINMLYYVFADIIPFVSIMFYSILAFAFIQSTFNDDSSKASGTLILNAFYNIVGGSSPGEDGLETFLIIINSIFNVIIMLNLLISIIGKTFDDVNDNQQIEDMSKVCDLIIEAESLIQLLNIQNQEFYIQLCDEYVPEVKEIEEEIQYKLKGMKDDIEKFESRTLQSHKLLLESIRQLEEKNDLILANIQKKNMDIMNNLDKIASNDKQCEIEGSTVCIKNHELSLKIIFKPYVCDYCYKGYSSYIYYCETCDLRMCLDCENFYKKNLLSKYTCCLGHRLIYYDDDSKFLKWEKLDAKICRYCNGEFNKNGLFCPLCLFFICTKCETLLNKYVEVTTFVTCEKNHKLIWKQHEHYEDGDLSQSCYKCYRNYIGVGFYFCEKCKCYLCIRCIAS